MLKTLFFLFFSMILAVVAFFALDQTLGLGYFKPKNNLAISPKTEFRPTDSLVFVHVKNEQKSKFVPFVLDKKKEIYSLNNNIKAKINPKIKIVPPASAKKKTEILGKKMPKKEAKKQTKKVLKKAPANNKKAKKNPCDCPCDKKNKKT